jgi:hypothetical protein
MLRRQAVRWLGMGLNSIAAGSELCGAHSSSTSTYIRNSPNKKHKDDLMRSYYLRQWGIEVPFRDGGWPAHVYCGVPDFPG